MSTTAPKPVTTPIPVQLSAPEFEAFLLPHLSMPKRGPKCTLGYYRVFRRFLKKNFLIQEVGAGLIKMDSGPILVIVKRETPDAAHTRHIGEDTYCPHARAA